MTPAIASNSTWVYQGRSHTNHFSKGCERPNQHSYLHKVALGQVLSNFTNKRRHYLSTSWKEEQSSASLVHFYFGLFFIKYVSPLCFSSFPRKPPGRPHFHRVNRVCHSWQGTVGVAEATQLKRLNQASKSWAYYSSILALSSSSHSNSVPYHVFGYAASSSSSH